MYTALAATSQTLAEYLDEEFTADATLGALFGGGGAMIVSLNSPEEMEQDSQEGVSIWLYRVNRDDDTLNRPMQRVNATQLRYPPLPLRLHYLVTPVVNRTSAGSALTEQTILGKALQLLHDHSRFRGSELRGDYQGTEVELHMRLEPMTLEEITRVWSALDRSYHLSVSYEVSLVNIESMRIDSLATVREVSPQTGIVVGA